MCNQTLAHVRPTGEQAIGQDHGEELDMTLDNLLALLSSMLPTLKVTGATASCLCV